jgi:hypothetical protein
MALDGKRPDRRRTANADPHRCFTGAGTDPAEAVIGRLNRLVARQLPEFVDTSRSGVPASPALSAAITQAQQASPVGCLRAAARAEQGALTTPQLLEELQQRKQVLKQAATTSIERATIEIVALLFQSILTRTRSPRRAGLVRTAADAGAAGAVSEPDFFAAVDHPARRLIDRMGSVRHGFRCQQPLRRRPARKGIKRVVQVVEAYPDTGRRVFQTVLSSSSAFSSTTSATRNEASKKGVSLAQQVEQRETMAIQYTIELRKMLNEVPVQEGVARVPVPGLGRRARKDGAERLESRATAPRDEAGRC